MTSTAPGSWTPLVDTYGDFSALAASLAEGTFAVLMDRRVATLHPSLAAALRARHPVAFVELAAGERAKSLVVLERVLGALSALTRNGTIVAVGGGTIGDLATVAAHLVKRGVSLIQVPTTLLAAVDSSVGGKGAVNVRSVKNGAGVFHYATASWICPEVFTTLDAKKLREGATEAWKMAACLSRDTWNSWRANAPEQSRLIREARQLKAQVCADDPYEKRGLRPVLNFGHTLGHVLESLSGYRLRHGEAVALGMLCALDVGRLLGVTPAAVAAEVGEVLARDLRSPGRTAIASVLGKGSDEEVSRLLMADKKNDEAHRLKMVLLEELGRWRLVEVPSAQLPMHAWRSGQAP